MACFTVRDSREVNPRSCSEWPELKYLSHRDRWATVADKSKALGSCIERPDYQASGEQSSSQVAQLISDLGSLHSRQDYIEHVRWRSCARVLLNLTTFQRRRVSEGTVAWEMISVKSHHSGRSGQQCTITFSASRDGQVPKAVCFHSTL